MMNLEQFMSKLRCKCLCNYYKEVGNIRLVEYLNKFSKLVLWDDEETEDTTPKNYKEVCNNIMVHVMKGELEGGEGPHT